MLKTFVKKFLAVIRGKRFGRFVIGFFIFEAAWIALTAAYPQAFDENFHFGLIKIYSHYWLPFLSRQPPNANAYGAVARDPSYLYHYLMSFPYRLIALFTSSQTIQVIWLRFINIGLFASGLVLFRKVLLKTRLSVGLSNLTILLFSLIPVVPQLAGQINYDSMLFPLVAAVCLLSFKLIDEIRVKKPVFKTYMSLLVVCFIASLVKYAFLPIFLAIALFFLYYLIRQFGIRNSSLFKHLAVDFKRHSIVSRVVLISALLVLVGVFIQRDGVNLIDYHAIAPNCSRVLSQKDCSAYSVWQTDNKRHLELVSGLSNSPSKNPLIYLMEWVYWMWYRLFYAINGPASSFTNYPPLPLPSAVAGIIALIGVAAVIKYRKKLFKSNPYFLLLSLICVFYVVALIIQGYSTYQFTATLEIMNGRYLLPILLLVIAMFGRAFTLALSRNKTLGVLCACLVLVLFLEGGGILTFIQRSDPSWDFNNPSVVKINDATRRLTGHLVLTGKKTYTTDIWFFN